MLELLPGPAGQVMAAPDQGTHLQIEAVKAHLLAQGLTDILEPPSSKEGYHSLRAMYDRRLRLLWISYQWLSDHPNPVEVVAYLRDKDIAWQLMTDTYSVTIHDRGTVQAERFV
jgi:hypothetical protein